MLKPLTLLAFASLALASTACAPSQPLAESAPVEPAPARVSESAAKPPVTESAPAEPARVSKSVAKPRSTESAPVEPARVSESAANPPITESAPAEGNDQPTKFAPITLAQISQEDAYQQASQLLSLPCDKQTEIQDNLRYERCTIEDTSGTQIYSVSMSMVELGDGVNYWLTPGGDIWAIRYLHSDEIYIFGEDGRLMAELIYPDRVKTDFTQTERDRVEDMDSHREAVAEILDAFPD